MQPTIEVVDSVRKFIRLTALTVNPKYTKRFRTELDLIEAIDVLQLYFSETERMVGKKMYKKQPFDFVEDVKRAMEEYLLTGRNEKESILARGKNLNMYHLVIVPIIEMFKDLSHEDALATLSESLDAVKGLMCTMELNTHYDDAVVVLAQVSDLIKIREQARKLEISTRKKGRRKSKRDELLDHVEAESNKDDLEVAALSF